MTSAPETAGPHGLRARRVAPRARLSEFLATAQAAAVRDAVHAGRPWFDRVFVVRPVHNAIGPLDLDGTFDERSDRPVRLTELIDRGDEDAYRQFIEPVVGASGEALEAERRPAERMDDPSAAPISGRVLVQELQREVEDELIERLGFQAAETVAEGGSRNDRLRHGPMSPGTANLTKVLADEFSGVSRVAEVPDRDHERLAKDSRHDRPLHVFQLQEEIGHVGNEVFPRRVAEERTEHLLDEPSRLRGADDIVEPFHRDFRALHLRIIAASASG